MSRLRREQALSVYPHNSATNSVRTCTGWDPQPLCGWVLSLAAGLIVVFAFGLRLYRLEYHSFWSDEGISLGRSSRALSDLLATMPVEQLPGYFVLLHF